LELAKRWNIKHFATPAGGCLLTDPAYSRRLQDLFEHESLAREDIEILRVGRHFRLGDKTKIIVGRDNADNEIISELATCDDKIIYSKEPPGPAVLLRGDMREENIRTAALLQKRYCKAREADRHQVFCRAGDEEDGEPMEIVGTLSEESLDAMIIR